MKKLFIGFIMLALLLIPVFGHSANGDVSESLTFTWEQLEAELPDISGWVLYQASTDDGPYVKVVDVPYTAVVPPVTTFESTTPLNISGITGTTVTKYFVVTAKNKDGVESEYSNVVSYGFVIPALLPSKPFNLILKITVTP